MSLREPLDFDFSCLDREVVHSPGSKDVRYICLSLCIQRALITSGSLEVLRPLTRKEGLGLG
jgi:hypothetical protein